MLFFYTLPVICITGDTYLFQYNIIPMGIQSLKVLAELPIIVVLMYQVCKQQVQNDMVEFIPLIMNTITLQPSAALR